MSEAPPVPRPEPPPAPSLFDGFDPLVGRPDAVAFEGEDRALTWAELEGAAAAWAARLAELGLRPGDRVALCAPSGLATVVAVVAHLRAGLVHVPINDRYRHAEIRHILEDSGAACLVAAPGGDAAATAEALGLPVVDLAEVPTTAAAAAADAPRWPAPAPLPAAPALIIYTSGTTGRSKGVLTSHGALTANLGATTALWRWSPDDTLALALPLFHVHGLGLGVLGALLRQVRVLLLPRFSPAAVARAFAEGGATVFMGVPTMYRQLLDWLDAHPERAAALARGRLFTSGSAALPAADLEAFAARTGHRILERYGMTETGFVLSNPHDGPRRAGTVGQPVPGWATRIVDDAGAACPIGEAGELQVRGDGLMDGYWGLPDATAAATTPDGWFRTGDVVAVDADGYHRIVGRSSVDIIKSGGFKLSAREIEEVLATHPDVAEVAVVGAPDPTWGEAVAAAVVLRGRGERGAAEVDEGALLGELGAHVAAALADFKKPRRLAVVDALPRNALGKVQKHLVKRRFE